MISIFLFLSPGQLLLQPRVPSTTNLPSKDFCAASDWQAPNRTILGREQRDWLAAGLTASNATYQLIGNPLGVTGPHKAGCPSIFDPLVPPPPPPGGAPGGRGGVTGYTARGGGTHFSVLVKMCTTEGPSVLLSL